MTPLAIFGMGAPELLIILAVILLLFGGSRLAGLGKSTGRALKEFKEETKGIAAKDSPTGQPIPPTAAPPTSSAQPTMPSVAPPPAAAPVQPPGEPQVSNPQAVNPASGDLRKDA